MSSALTLSFIFSLSLVSVCVCEPIKFPDGLDCALKVTDDVWAGIGQKQYVVVAERDLKIFLRVVLWMEAVEVQKVEEIILMMEINVLIVDVLENKL